MRKMGLDYGERRIGIAFSDLTNTIASAYETYLRVDLDKDLQHLLNLANSNNVDEIVIGLPLNMDGSEGDRAEKTREFALKLEQITNLKTTFVDERLTSVEAEEILKNSNVKPKDYKKYIDKLSASIILQDYLNSI